MNRRIGKVGDDVKVLLAIPVYNEQKHVREVLAEVRRYAGDILVINDGSTDDTARLLDEEAGIHVIHHGRNFGYGQSLVDAFNYAICHGFDWIIPIDCDLQHEPASIPDFIARQS